MNNNKFIIVDDSNIPIIWGRSLSFDGIHSKQKLYGIELKMKVHGKWIEEIENLLDKNSVKVQDPFSDRDYVASIRLRQSTYREGEDWKAYIIELKQIESIPEFEFLEIEGRNFKVLKYEEQIVSKDNISRFALLRLSREELDNLRKLFELQVVKVRRVGVDVDPLDMRFGGQNLWSHHNDDGQDYFKQIVRLLTDMKPVKYRLASGVVQNHMENMLIAMCAKFEILVKELAENKLVSEEKKNALLSTSWTEYFPIEKVDHLYDSFRQVIDAEEEF